MSIDGFSDRQAAGKALGARLRNMGYAAETDVVVLGLPRGGIPVACEVAAELRAPLDVFVVRKLGVPGQEELAMGAIAGGGVRELNSDVIRLLGVSPEDIERAIAREQVELQRREELYRGSRPAARIAGQCVIIVDDGLATGASMRAAIAALRQRKPRRIVVAVPVGAPDTCALLKRQADEVLCLLMPPFFHAVGQWYEEFSQTSDAEVRELLARARPPSPDVAGGGAFATPR